MITGNSALFPQCGINILTNVCKPKTFTPAVKSSRFSMIYSKQNTEYVPSHHKGSKTTGSLSQYISYTCGLNNIFVKNKKRED